jgi:tetratricopeptide (TPR) repeat protein
MESSVEHAGRRVLLIASLAVSALLIFQAGEIWLANHRLDSAQVAAMTRGVALIPGDGSAWDRLGRMRQWDFVNSDLPGAIEDYRKAVGDDPRSAHFWMDLASAYEASGDDARARDAYMHAKAAYPASAEVAFHFGNFLLREQEYSAAYGELQRAVHGDPSLLPLAISRTWRASEDIDELLNDVLPANTEAYLQALDFFASIHEAQPGLAVWQRLTGLGKPFPISRVFPFFEELIREDRSNEARGVWRGALAAAGLPHDEPKNENLVWNGDFTRDFANGGLDWRWTPLLDVELSVDPDQAPNGSRAIRLDFNGGANLAVAEPAQFVAVEPGRRYHFRGFMRTEGITTESGMRFYLTDANHNGALGVQTDNLTGSHPWTAEEADFETGPETHFVLVELSRAPSRLFENKLEGTVWIASVSMIPLEPSSPQDGRTSP